MCLSNKMEELEGCCRYFRFPKLFIIIMYIKQLI